MIELYRAAIEYSKSRKEIIDYMIDLKDLSISTELETETFEKPQRSSNIEPYLVDNPKYAMGICKTGQKRRNFEAWFNLLPDFWKSKIEIDVIQGVYHRIGLEDKFLDSKTISYCWGENNRLDLDSSFRSTYNRSKATKKTKHTIFCPVLGKYAEPLEAARPIVIDGQLGSLYTRNCYISQEGADCITDFVKDCKKAKFNNRIALMYDLDNKQYTTFIKGQKGRHAFCETVELKPDSNLFELIQKHQ